jgi:hypothetical protein
MNNVSNTILNKKYYLYENRNLKIFGQSILYSTAIIGYSVQLLAPLEKLIFVSMTFHT